MKKHPMRWGIIALAVAAIITVSACKKKAAPAPPPPPPAPAAPTASLTANPVSIQPGQSTTLSWTTQNATEATLEGMGPVGLSGSQTVLPKTSTTYRLTAKGAGGTQQATARVTVIAPPPPVTAAPAAGEQELFARNMKDIHFDYDKYDVRASERPVLEADAAFLKSHPDIRFTIEGHCDERGSTEYNLALGDNRANAVKPGLVNLGVPAGSIKTISYGKEKPVCTDHNEACWQQNRRAHFAYGQ